MKHFLIDRSSSKTIYYYVMVLLMFSGFLSAQSGAFVLSWDKTGCQQNDADKIIITNTNECLKVCKENLFTYRVSGELMPTIDHIEWTIVGGESEVKDEFAAIKWDNTYNGSIKLSFVFLDGSILNRTICVTKETPNLILGWDKIGCQYEEDNVSEIKFNFNFATAECLKVCKGSKLGYKISGNDSENINHILWTVTGGEAATANEFATQITWNDSPNGSILIRIEFNNGSVVERAICVSKVNSSILLDWEKTEESSVSQIKVDSSEEKPDCLIVYPESTVNYRINGKNIDTIETVYWEVVGGYAYNNHGLYTPITWYDEENNYVIIHITYIDGSMLDRKFSILKMARPGGGIFAQADRLLFKYDEAGNQKERKLCINCGSARMSNPETNDESRNEEVIKDGNLTFYPNPVNEELHIDFGLSDEVKKIDKIEVYSLGGQLIKTYSDIKNQTSLIIPFNNLSQGMYLVNVVYGNGEVTDLKIQKK
jgi:Secretion system C-terminal sorting domain